eukprot:507913_1
MKSKKQGNNTINKINIPSLLKHNRKRAPVTLTAPVNILHKVKVDGRFKNGGMKPWNPIYALFKYTWEVSAQDGGRPILKNVLQMQCLYCSWKWTKYDASGEANSKLQVRVPMSHIIGCYEAPKWSKIYAASWKQASTVRASRRAKQRYEYITGKLLLGGETAAELLRFTNKNISKILSPANRSMTVGSADYARINSPSTASRCISGGNDKYVFSGNDNININLPNAKGDIILNGPYYTSSGKHSHHAPGQFSTCSDTRGDRTYNEYKEEYDDNDIIKNINKAAENELKSLIIKQKTGAGGPGNDENRNSESDIEIVDTTPSTANAPTILLTDIDSDYLDNNNHNKQSEIKIKVEPKPNIKPPSFRIPTDEPTHKPSKELMKHPLTEPTLTQIIAPFYRPSIQQIEKPSLERVPIVGPPRIASMSSIPSHMKYQANSRIPSQTIQYLVSYGEQINQDYANSLLMNTVMHGGKYNENQSAEWNEMKWQVLKYFETFNAWPTEPNPAVLSGKLLLDHCKQMELTVSEIVIKNIYYVFATDGLSQEWIKYLLGMPIIVGNFAFISFIVPTGKVNDAQGLIGITMPMLNKFARGGCFNVGQLGDCGGAERNLKAGLAAAMGSCVLSCGSHLSTNILDHVYKALQEVKMKTTEIISEMKSMIDKLYNSGFGIEYKLSKGLNFDDKFGNHPISTNTKSYGRDHNGLEWWLDNKNDLLPLINDKCCDKFCSISFRNKWNDVSFNKDISIMTIYGLPMRWTIKCMGYKTATASITLWHINMMLNAFDYGALFQCGGEFVREMGYNSAEEKNEYCDSKDEDEETLDFEKYEKGLMIKQHGIAQYFIWGDVGDNDGHYSLLDKYKNEFFVQQYNHERVCIIINRYIYDRLRKDFLCGAASVNFLFDLCQRGNTLRFQKSLISHYAEYAVQSHGWKNNMYDKCVKLYDDYWNCRGRFNEEEFDPERYVIYDGTAPPLSLEIRFGAWKNVSTSYVTNDFFFKMSKFVWGHSVVFEQNNRMETAISMLNLTSGDDKMHKSSKVKLREWYLRYNTREVRRYKQDKYL